MKTTLERRTFLGAAAAAAASAAAASAALPLGEVDAARDVLLPAPRPKKPCLVRGAFFYPPAGVVLAGECEDAWSPHAWSTWPGNQFKPEEQQAKFTKRLADMAAGLDIDLAIEAKPVYTDKGIAAFIAEIQESEPAALLLVNFWNSFSGKIVPILDAFDGPIILYHPVGANHQLPPQRFRTEPRMQYIHSIEHWEALEDGLRAVHAMNRMRQSRLLRVSGRLQEEADAHEAFFDMPIHGVPAGQFNDLFDSIELTREMKTLARGIRRRAKSVTDLSQEAFLDAVRAHAAVLGLMERHDADAITIECLFLKHRKPCLSFALNNGALVPCGCENHLDGTLTLMLGANLFGRGGFLHNPEFDLQQNCYFASHCTCTTRLHGPQGPGSPYALRPFFHQMPKTLALDVQWPAGEAATLLKYHSGKDLIDAWAGEVVSSPSCPPTGGCATRALVKIHSVDDVCDVYPGPHPVLFCGDFARRCRALAGLYGLEVKTNA